MCLSDFSTGQKTVITTGAMVIESKVGQLAEQLANIGLAPTFITAYVSPFLDIDQVGDMITSRFPGVPKTICTTAGELHAHQGQLYCEAGQYWDRVVVQCFDGSIIEQAEVVSLSLGCEDLRQKKITTSLQERIGRLKKKIQSLKVSMDIDHRDTFAYVLFDGLSASESFFMEALYDSGCFPCLFVGGSAGGKPDFQHTWLHDGHQKRENQALIAFLKIAPGTRFGVMKSQNFVPVNVSFSILSASVEYRYISQVIDQKGKITSLVNALCDTFQCKPSALEEIMADYSFAIFVGKELFVRSISWIDIEMDTVHFYCDISPGEELMLVKRGDLIQNTDNDFKRFMHGKPGAPIAGILNDCILRRQLNENKLFKMGRILTGTAIAGFSTFGEILGLNLNQTLTGIFFFRVPDGVPFKDEYIDNFALHYGEFKAFFLKRQISKLNGLSHIVVRQIENFKGNQYGSRLDSTGMDPTMATVFDGLNDLGQVLSEADTQRQLRASEIEEQLRESEERFRLLAESSLTGIYLVQNNQFSYVNDIFAHMFGYTVSEIFDRLSITDLCSPEDQALVLENIRRREAGEEQSVRYAFRALRKNGSTFYVEVHGRSIKYKGQVGIIGTLIDITEQKKAEKSLQASEERYRAFYNETPSMFYTVNSEGTITAVNDFGAKQLGYSKNELLGNFYLNIFHEEDKDAVHKGITASLLTREQTFQWQFRKIRKNGSQMWSEEFVRSVDGPNGEMNILVVCQDITERKQLEESLKLTRFIFDKVSVGIFLVEDNSRVIDVNEYGCNSLGYTKNELCHLTVPDFDLLFDKDWFIGLSDVLNKSKSTTFRTTYKRKNGEIFPVQIFVSALPHSNQNLRVAFVQDMSDWEQARIKQKKLEAQLKQVQKLESIGRLAGGIAHDLNNLLTPILGYAELLSLDKSINDKAKKKLTQVSKAATGAKDLVKQLLAFSRKQILEYYPLDINLVLDSFENLIRRTVRENIEISISKADEMMFILADQGQIEQVLLNLIVNASDAMPNGGKLHIQTRVAELDTTDVESHPDIVPGRYVMLEITDTGEGMNKETLANIFEPFFSTKGDQGTGLGLATVYGILKQHNGSILVKSKLGKGSSFTIYLPVTENLPRQGSSRQKSQCNICGKETLLLVEDNEAVRTTVYDILREKGYQVITAVDGKAALEMVYADITFDMLITDVIMPGMNGKELYARVSKKKPALKVLYMSGYTDDIIIQHGVDGGQAQYIQKPFTSLSIVQKVREVLDS